MGDQWVSAWLATLPQRFLGAEDRFSCRYRVSVGPVTRDVIVTSGGCRVEPPSGTPDAAIVTDAGTWGAIDSGTLSAIEAFSQRRLSVRGSIEKAVRFEPFFEREDGGGFRYHLAGIDVGDAKLSAVVAGDPGAEPLVLVHGLGATKASWLLAAPALARDYRVIAIDLPGFGSSSKPRGRYDAPWFAERIFPVLDHYEYESAHFAGNSMGGRIIMEMAMMRPDRVKAVACLCPAAAFSRRRALPLVRVAIPELAAVAARLPRARLRMVLRQLFADPNRLEPDWLDAVMDDFLRLWRRPAARIAFACAARSTYLDEPLGDGGFWTRLHDMKTPALYLYGEADPVISSRFAGRIERTLPNAEVLVWEDCGHVPQVEWPERTATAMLDFFARQARVTAAPMHRMGPPRPKQWAQ